MQLNVIVTADGSSSLFVPELNENYHSVHGAIQESVHVFINAAFRQCKKKSISVFEAGFGTGLNAFLTAIEAINSKTPVHYTAIELYPLDSILIRQLNYTKMLKGYDTIFQNIHENPWEKNEEIHTYFTLKKINADLTTYTPTGNYDVVYFDAFAPQVHPALWTPEVFQKITKCMNPGGILTTYSAKGEVRRTLKSLGLSVELIPGPPGKREMIQAVKT